MKYFKFLQYHQLWLNFPVFPYLRPNFQKSGDGSQNSRNGNKCIIIINCLKSLIMTRKQNIVFPMKGHVYPFGSCHVRPNQKIFISTLLPFSNSTMKMDLLEKISTAKTIVHRNLINVKTVQETETSFQVYYDYIEHPITSEFLHEYPQNLKEVHKQMINLAIHLAKKEISISFNPGNFGANIIDGKTIIKYYLHLADLKQTKCLKQLERSVEVFTYQTLNWLDQLTQTDSEEFVKQGMTMMEEEENPEVIIKERRSKNEIRKLSCQAFMTRESRSFRKLHRLSRDRLDLESESLYSKNNSTYNSTYKEIRKQTYETSNGLLFQKIHVCKVRAVMALNRFKISQTRARSMRAMVQSLSKSLLNSKTNPNKSLLTVL